MIRRAVGFLASVALHGFVLFLLLGGNESPPDDSDETADATIEMIQQDTLTSGGDRYVRNEGQPGQQVGSQSGGGAAPASSSPSPPSPPLPDPSLSSLDAAAALPRDGEGIAAPLRPPAARRPATAAQVRLDDDGRDGGDRDGRDRDGGERGGEVGTGRITKADAVVPAGIDTTAPNVPPAYPPDAAKRGEQGHVGLRIAVRADGGADAVQVVESSGVASLDDAARRAALRWHFRPAVRAGLRVASVLLFRFDFVLSDNTATAEGKAGP